MPDNPAPIDHIQKLAFVEIISSGKNVRRRSIVAFDAERRASPVAAAEAKIAADAPDDMPSGILETVGTDIRVDAERMRVVADGQRESFRSKIV